MVVRFDHGFFRKNLEENVKKVSRKLGVDILTFTPNWKVVQKLMLQSLLEKGDFCWHCHTGIFSYPMWIAIEKKIPLIFWGEPQPSILRITLMKTKKMLMKKDSIDL